MMNFEPFNFVKDTLYAWLIYIAWQFSSRGLHLSGLLCCLATHHASTCPIKHLLNHKVFGILFSFIFLGTPIHTTLGINTLCAVGEPLTHLDTSVATKDYLTAGRMTPVAATQRTTRQRRYAVQENCTPATAMTNAVGKTRLTHVIVSVVVQNHMIIAITCAVMASLGGAAMASAVVEMVILLKRTKYVVRIELGIRDNTFAVRGSFCEKNIQLIPIAVGQERTTSRPIYAAISIFS